jgi:hypothetical protein
MEYQFSIFISDSLVAFLSLEKHNKPYIHLYFIMLVHNYIFLLYCYHKYSSYDQILVFTVALNSEVICSLATGALTNFSVLFHNRKKNGSNV